MKSLATSTVLHTLLLTWGLWSFGQPQPLDMTQGETLPVSIVPVEEYSTAVLGEREAEMTDTPAPAPTETPETLPQPAENVGDNEVDLASLPRPEIAPRERVQTATEQAAAPPPQPPAPEPEPEPVAQPEPEPAPAEPEMAEPAPAPEPVIDEAAPEIAEASPEPEPEAAAAPQNVPTPQIRPTPPARPAEPVRETPPTPARPEAASEPEREVAESATETEPEFDADEIAALLNRDTSAGGGAQRSEQQASLGASRTTGETLSQSEQDALLNQLRQCWSIPAGIMDPQNLRVEVQFNLNASGSLAAMPQIQSSSGNRTFDESAVRAIRRCDSQGFAVPPGRESAWSDITILFVPSEMF